MMHHQVYYPQDLEDFLDLFRGQFSLRQSAACAVHFEEGALGSTSVDATPLLDQLALLHAKVISVSATNARAQREHAKRIFDQYRPKEDSPSDASISLGDPSRAEDPEGLYMVFGDSKDRLRIDSSAEARDDYLTVFGTLLDQPSSAKVRILVCNLYDTMIARKAAKVALTLQSYQPEPHLETVAIVTIPPGPRGSEAVGKYICVEGLSMKNLPQWADYDHVEHFVRLAWSTFNDGQQSAAEHITTLTGELHESLRLLKVIDIGCGRGDILRAIGDRYRDIECVGIDPASRRLPRETKPNNLTYRCGMIENVSSGDLACADQTMVCFLGNTLPHIGARGLRDWLQPLNQIDRPKFILFDFEINFRRRLIEEGITIEQVESLSADGVEASAIWETSVHHQEVSRRIVLQFPRNGDKEAGRIAQHDILIKQHSDGPDSYFEVLRRNGYNIAPKGRYSSGWGVHDLYLAEACESAQEFPRPGPPPGDRRLINDIWYQELTKLWQLTFGTGKNEVDSRHHRSYRNAEYYPVAILPFDEGANWARYVARGDKREDEAFRELFECWLLMLGIHEVVHVGRIKSEDDPVYAFSFHEALTGEVQMSFVEPVNERLKRMHASRRPDLNDADRFVCDQEARYLDRLTSERRAYYVIPIYVEGLPTFCVIVRGLESQTPPEVVLTLLRHEKDVITSMLKPHFRTTWRSFLGKCMQLADQPEILGRILDDVTSGERTWKSWLETLPAVPVHEVTRIQDEWESFKRYHSSVWKDWKLRPQHRISRKLDEDGFFRSEKLGHENLTSQHVAFAKNSARAFAESDTRVEKYALEALQDMATCENAPENDRDSLSGAPDYDRANFRFQLFKALFCRSEANMGEQYRISPLAIFAARDIFVEGSRKPRTWLKDVEEPMLYTGEGTDPKLALEDPWAFYRNLWVGVSAFRTTTPRLQEVFIRAITGKRKEIQIEVRFPEPARFRAAANGQSARAYIEGLERIVEHLIDHNPGDVNGYLIRLLDQDGKHAALDHSWLPVQGNEE